MYDNVLFLSSPCTQVQHRQLKLATKLQKLCGEVFVTLLRNWAWNSSLAYVWSTSLIYALCLFFHKDVAHKVKILKNECLNFDLISHECVTRCHTSNRVIGPVPLCQFCIWLPSLAIKKCAPSGMCFQFSLLCFLFYFGVQLSSCFSFPSCPRVFPVTLTVFFSPLA